MHEDNLISGYRVCQYDGPVKRYCRTLELRNNPELIAEYRRRHSEDGIRRQVIEGIREVGILEMEIYLVGTHLFMIVETPVDFDWDSAMARLATLPGQQEWEDYMAEFQVAEQGASADEKWRMMERIFYLYK